MATSSSSPGNCCFDEARFLVLNACLFAGFLHRVHELHRGNDPTLPCSEPSAEIRAENVIHEIGHLFRLAHRTAAGSKRVASPLDRRSQIELLILQLRVLDLANQLELFLTVLELCQLLDVVSREQ